MVKKTLFIWIFLLIFGFTSMPEVGVPNTSKLTGKTELTKKKPRKKVSRKKTSRKKGTKKRSHKKSLKKKSTKKSSKKKYSSKKKRGSKNKRSAGKKKYSKRRKGSKRNRRNRRVSHRRVYTPPTNSNSVEYRNYQRNNNGNEAPEQNIEKIAPPKEIKKDPKKEGE